MKDTRRVKDIEDLSADLERTRVNLKSFHRKVIGLGIDYQNKITGKPDSKYIHEIRDSIGYRFQSCEYLFHLLNKHQFQDEADLTQHLPKQMAPGVLELVSPDLTTVFTMASIERPCLFDSMVYHLCSTFDYAGGLVELICGQQGKNRLKWNPLVRTVTDKSSVHAKAKVAEVILNGHKEFVDGLYRHRSRIIHDLADIGAFEYTIYPGSSRATLQMFVTQKFVNEFPELKALSQEYKITLRYSAHYLMNKTVELLIAILLKLREDLEANRKIPPEKEVITFKNNDGQFISGSTLYWA